jgi:hypothetical protein
VVIGRLSNTKVSENMRIDDPDPVVGAQMRQDDRTSQDRKELET